MNSERKAKTPHQAMTDVIDLFTLQGRQVYTKSQRAIKKKKIKDVTLNLVNAQGSLFPLMTTLQSSQM